MIPLKSIKEEAADCRAAFAAMPEAEAGLHIHHEEVAERLTEPVEIRIAYILSDKPKIGQAVRLRAMRPLTATAWKLYEETRAPAVKLYEETAATAWKLYEETAATARKLYDETVAPAVKLYDETAATAVKLYEETRATAHAAICVADCPWRNGTLFPDKVA